MLIFKTLTNKQLKSKIFFGGPPFLRNFNG